MASAASDRQILGLDLMRFGAASMVMLYHLAFASWAVGDSAVSKIVGGIVAFPALAPVSWFGWVGVEIFFVLSGIVICLSAERATAFRFARSRIVRLYPAAWLCGTITLAALLLIGQSDLANRYVRTMLLFPTGPWVAAVYWTLAHEMAFYALIYLLLLARKFRYLPHLLTTLGLASTAFWGLLLLDESKGLGPALHTMLMLGLGVPAKFVLGFGCFFALGGFIYLCAGRQCTPWRLAMITVCASGSIVRIFWRTGRIDQAVDMPIDFAVPAAIWAAAVLLMAASLIWNASISRLLGRYASSLREIGLATYPLYLLHAPLGAILILGLRTGGVGQGLALAIAIGAVVALSFAVSMFVERPLQNGLRHALTRAAASVIAHVSSMRKRNA